MKTPRFNEVPDGWVSLGSFRPELAKEMKASWKDGFSTRPGDDGRVEVLVTETEYNTPVERKGGRKRKKETVPEIKEVPVSKPEPQLSVQKIHPPKKVDLDFSPLFTPKIDSGSDIFIDIRQIVNIYNIYEPENKARATVGLYGARNKSVDGKHFLVLEVNEGLTHYGLKVDEWGAFEKEGPPRRVRVMVQPST